MEVLASEETVCTKVSNLSALNDTCKTVPVSFTFAEMVLPVTKVNWMVASLTVYFPFTVLVLILQVKVLSVANVRVMAPEVMPNLVNCAATFFSTVVAIAVPPILFSTSSDSNATAGCVYCQVPANWAGSTLVVPINEPNTLVKVEVESTLEVTLESTPDNTLFKS